MKDLRGPQLELNFYYAELPERDSFDRLLKALINLGAEPAGKGIAHVGTHAQSVFGSPYDLPCDVIVFSPTELGNTLADPKLRFINMSLINAIGLASQDVAEELQFVPISESAAKKDKHPVAVYTDGNAFSYPPEFTDISKARNAGRQVYERFIALIKETKPSYAAITYEYYMKCPTDLHSDPSLWEFRDFYIGEEILGSEYTNTIRELYNGAYIESVEHGLYISCYEYFNPDGVNSSDNPPNRAAVAKIITSHYCDI